MQLLPFLTPQSNNMYQHYAKVTRVYSAEILLLSVDLGLGIKMNDIFKLKDIKITKPILALEFVRSLNLEEVRVMAFRSRGWKHKDFYGRYEVDLLYAGPEKAESLTRQLVEKKFAKWEVKE